MSQENATVVQLKCQALYAYISAFLTEIWNLIFSSAFIAFLLPPLFAGKILTPTLLAGV